MTEPADEATIQWLLGELHSGDPNRRWAGAREVDRRSLRDERLIAVLKTLVVEDPTESVRRAARQALGSEAPAEPAAKPKDVLTRNEKIRDFLIGFVSWYVVNGVIWMLISYTSSNAPLVGIWILNIWVLPVNLLVLIILAFVRRWVAWGIVASYAVNFLIAMIFGLILQAACWIPFFIK
jgi:hypothetical protein